LNLSEIRIIKNYQCHTNQCVPNYLQSVDFFLEEDERQGKIEQGIDVHQDTDRGRIYFVQCEKIQK
jgi:hypothetical protein